MIVVMKKVVMGSEVKIDSDYLPINVTKRTGCYLEMLEATKGQLDNLLTRYSRIMVIRFDLHQYKFTDDSKHISRFFEKIKKRLGQRYELRNIGHIWVRELEKAKHQHYHCALMVNAHMIRYPKGVIELIESIWQGWNHPKPYTPANCYSIIERNDKASYDESFKRLSYLAKARGKGYKPNSANDYSCSRIKPCNRNKS